MGNQGVELRIRILMQNLSWRENFQQ